jgi:hypothetical protein
MADNRERKAAEAKFKKSERATEGAKAMADYKAEGEAERAKTVRLKAQRLAKEAADKKKATDPLAAVKEQTVGNSTVTRAAKMVLSPDDPTAKAKRKAARVKK